MGRKIKSVGPVIPGDPVCFPEALNLLCVEHGGACSVPHANFLQKRQEEELQGLFVQDRTSVGPRLDFISLPPPAPSPFICKSSAKKTRFPNIAPH